MNKKIASLSRRLQEIEYNSLPISDYNKQYIATLLPVLNYYMRIYEKCLQEGIRSTGLSPKDITCVDYGGGSGFLSMAAKELGIGRVVYIDLNPLSVKTITLLKEQTGIGPDIILEGNSDKLVEWSRKQSPKPQLLIATDLIEHVYDLDLFIADLAKVNPQIHLFFTTASNPYNPYICRKLKKLMHFCEEGEMPIANYREKRTQFIRQEYPNMTEEELNKWADSTRGLVYSDIKTAIKNNRLPAPNDSFNTCDPATGNWTERILPIHTYHTLFERQGFSMKIRKGFYNTERNSPLKVGLFRFLNRLIRLTGNGGFIISPFILISCRPK